MPGFGLLPTLLHNQSAGSDLITIITFRDHLPLVCSGNAAAKGFFIASHCVVFSATHHFVPAQEHFKIRFLKNIPLIPENESSKENWRQTLHFLLL